MFFTTLHLGVDTYVMKEVSIRPKHASDFIGGIFALRVLLSVVLLGAMVLTPGSRGARPRSSSRSWSRALPARDEHQRDARDDLASRDERRPAGGGERRSKFVWAPVSCSGSTSRCPSTSWLSPFSSPSS